MLALKNRITGVVAGIDVGGPAKGFHCAIADIRSGKIEAFFRELNPESVVERIRSHQLVTGKKLLAVAIDSPRKQLRRKEETRAAERALVKKGYRVLWTPRNPGPGSQWMGNGELVFDAMMREFPEVEIMETFPTAISDRIHGDEIFLDLSLFHGKKMRKHYKDFLDAALATATARMKLLGKSEALGEEDELGPVLLPSDRLVDHTLVLILRNDQVLLGMKKRGFGAGFYNGFGGKLEPGETPVQAARRELMEEAGIECTDLKQTGNLHFTFENDEKAIRGFVFHGETITGEPRETDEMKPRWFSLDNIPFDKMWPDDPIWFPAFLAGGRFDGYFHFDRNRKLSLWRMDVS